MAEIKEKEREPKALDFAYRWRKGVGGGGKKEL